MYHFEAHLMVSSSEVYRPFSTQDDNLVKVFLWDKGKIAIVMLDILDGFFFGMSSDVPVF